MERNWDNYNIDLGAMVPNQTYKVVYKSLKELEIVDLGLGCSCTQAEPYNKEKKELVVLYTPPNVPVHLVHQGGYPVHRDVAVKYQDGSTEILKFKGYVSIRG